jgi:hypothetical protein
MKPNVDELNLPAPHPMIAQEDCSSHHGAPTNTAPAAQTRLQNADLRGRWGVYYVVYDPKKRSLPVLK